MNIHHSSRSDLWYTPVNVMNRVRSVLGCINLDPASDSEANDIVEAKHILTQYDDSLNCDWSGHNTIYLNPPGGKIGNKSQSILFYEKLLSYRHQFDHAIYMGFSVEQLSVSQRKGFPSIMKFPFCVPAQRLKFISPDGDKSSPSHANVIAYIPGRVDARDLFEDAFIDLGDVIV